MLALDLVGLKVAVWSDGSEYLNRLVTFLRAREFDFEVCTETDFPVGFGLVLIGQDKEGLVPADFGAVWVVLEPQEMLASNDPFAFIPESVGCLKDPFASSEDDPFDLEDHSFTTSPFAEGQQLRNRSFLYVAGLEELYLRLRDAELGLSDVCFRDSSFPVYGPRFLKRRQSSKWIYDELDCQLDGWVESGAEVCFLNVPQHDVSWHKLLRGQEVDPEVRRARAERFQALLDGKLERRIFLIHPSRELLARWIEVLKDTDLQVVALSDVDDYQPLMLNFMPSFVFGSAELNSNAGYWNSLFRSTNASHHLRVLELGPLEERVPEALLPFVRIEMERAGCFLTLRPNCKSEAIHHQRLKVALMSCLDQLYPSDGRTHELLCGLDEVFRSSRICVFESDWNGSWRIRLDDARVSWSSRTFALEFEGRGEHWTATDVYFCHIYNDGENLSMHLRWAESLLATRELNFELSLKTPELELVAA